MRSIRVGGTRVRTTFVTGMLTNMVENAVQYLLQFSGGHSHAHPPNRPLSRATLGQRAVTFGTIFFSFLLGGICGGLGEVRWGALALLAPIVGLLIVAFEEGFGLMRR